LWFRILWALTYVGTVLLLMISVNHCILWPVSEKHILENGICYLYHPIFAHESSWIHYITLGIIHFHRSMYSVQYGSTCCLKRIPESIPVNVKVTNTGILPGCLLKPLFLWEVNMYYLSTRTQKKLNSWQKFEENMHVFIT
jgi:hypothetical protein